MKTVVFHLQAKTCEKDISKLKEEILSYNIRIEEKELSEVKEEKDGILAITDQFSDVDYAKEHNIAVIFYETPGTNRSVSGVDMVVQGFEELNVEYLQLIYMRHHGLPWIIAKTDRICIRESVEGDLTAFRKLYQEEGMLDLMVDVLEGEEQAEIYPFDLNCYDSTYRLLKDADGIAVIDTQYLAPLAGIKQGLQYYIRRTRSGQEVVAVKTGFELLALIAASNAEIIKDAFLDNLQDLRWECGRWADKHQQQEEDAAQLRIDPETGEVEGNEDV